MTATVSFTIDSPLGPRTATVAYERKGAGEPLLLLHGIGHHLQAWHPVTDVLAGQYDVIAVDLPGFGASAPLPEGSRTTWRPSPRPSGRSARRWASTARTSRGTPSAGCSRSKWAGPAWPAR